MMNLLPEGGRTPFANQPPETAPNREDVDASSNLDMPESHPQATSSSAGLTPQEPPILDRDAQSANSSISGDLAGERIPQATSLERTVPDLERTLSEEAICNLVSAVGDATPERSVGPRVTNPLPEGLDTLQAPTRSDATSIPAPQHDVDQNSSWWGESISEGWAMARLVQRASLVWSGLVILLCVSAAILAWGWTQHLSHWLVMRGLGIQIGPASEPSLRQSGDQAEQNRGSAEQAAGDVRGRPSSPGRTAGGLPPMPPPPADWETRVKQAGELLRLPTKLPETAEELNREAFLVCQHLIEDLPDRPEALALAAMLHNRQGKYVEAEKLWRQALELNANFAPAFNGLGWLASRREALDEAVDYLRRAVQLDPYAGHSHSLLVDVLLRQNRGEEALVAARNYVAHFPKAGDSNYWLGQALMQLGRFEEAKKAHLAAIQCEPDYTAAYHSLSLVCARLGEREEARKWREKFVELKEKEMEQDRQRSRQYQDLPTQQRLAANFHLAAGNVHTSFGDPRKAEAHWIRGAAIAPHTMDCRLALATFYEQSQRLREACEQWEEISRLPEAQAGHWFRKGQVERRLGLFAQAEKSFRQAAALAPTAPEPYEALVDLLLQYGHHVDDAATLAQKAVELSPTPQNYFALSAVRETLGDLSGALQALEEALRREPAHPLLKVAYQELQKRSSQLRPQP